jgi:N-acetylneuraminate lyase
MANDLKGIFPALVTPFNREGELDEDMLREVIEYQLRAGVNGFYLCGGTGEGLLLAAEERKEIVKTAIDQIKGRATVIAHIGAFQTHETLELAEHAQDAGVDAISCLPPTFFYQLDIDGLFSYYELVASSSNLPLLLYNIPHRTGVNITPNVMRRLMKIPNVAGLKHATLDIFQLRNLIELGEGNLIVIEGEDPVLLPALMYGADGGIGCTYNIMPQLFVRIYNLYLEKRYEEAAKTQFQINRIINVLLKYDVIAATKETMTMMGMDVGPGRTPQRSMTEQEKSELREGLNAQGFFDLVKSE